MIIFVAVNDSRGSGHYLTEYVQESIGTRIDEPMLSFLLFHSRAGTFVTILPFPFTLESLTYDNQSKGDDCL